MKKVNSFIRYLLFILIFLTGINQTIIAQYRIICFDHKCRTVYVPSKMGMCSGETLNIYATDPYVIYPYGCNGTYQWKKLAWGYHCHFIPPASFCHTGYFTIIMESDTNNMYTVTKPGEYWCTVDCGDGPFNTDTIQFYYHDSGPNISQQPQSQKTCPGDDITFSLGAVDAVNYQWQKIISQVWKNISGAASSSYSYIPILEDNVDTFRCIVSNGCDTVYSNEIKLFVTQPFSKEEICLVTVDLETGKNLIVWEKTPDAGVEYYKIYRETDTAGIYIYIGIIPVDQLSVFVDEGSLPEEQQHLYKISAVDTCGSESDLSSYHKTLFLQYVGATGGVNLRWDNYEVEGVPINFKSYVIYRGTDSTQLTEVKTISGSLTSWTDPDPVASSSRQYYRIAGVISEVCDPANLLGKKADSGPYSHSMSNIEDNRFQTGMKDLKLAGDLTIYPNPSADDATICFPNPKKSEYQLIVRDLTGKMVLIISNIIEDKVVIERDKLKAGYYLVEVIGGNMYRGKLIFK